jgi:hypothetical protein
VEGLDDLVPRKGRPVLKAAKGSRSSASRSAGEIDPAQLPAFVAHLLVSVRDEEKLIDDLCGAVLRRDWAAASDVAVALAPRRGLDEAKSCLGPRDEAKS